MNLRSTAFLVVFSLLFFVYDNRCLAHGMGGPADTTQWQTVELARFGVRSNSFENASPAITAALQSCRGKRQIVLRLPGGRIDLWPEGAAKRALYISNGTEDDTLSKIRNIGILLDSLQDVVVEGNNSLLVLHGKMISFAILGSRNITVRNMRVDYERPTMSEFIVQSISGSEATLQAHPDTRYYIDSGRISLYGEGWKSRAFHTIRYEPGTQKMTYSSFQPFLNSRAVSATQGIIRFAGNFSGLSLHPGDVLTVRDPYRDNAGAFIHRSEQVKLENLRMQYMHGLGIVSQFATDISLIKVLVAPAEGSGRVISSFADCFHFSGCRGRILIDSCLTSGSHDDPINVHGTHLKIVSVGSGNRLTLRFMHHQTYGFPAFFAGDSIAFIDPRTLLPKGTGLVRKSRMLNSREMELELDGPFPAAMQLGDCLENLTWTPEVIIRNSRFERTNTRGILVTTRRRVLIENNTFFRTGMHAILIADDAASWFESGAVRDITIRNNRFEECGYNSAPDNYVIAIAPENQERVAGKYVHRNIRIEQNYFKVFDSPLLTAKSVDGLIFRNNRVEQLGSGKATRPAFRVRSSSGLLIRENEFQVPWVPEIEASDTPAKNIRTTYRIVSIPE